MSWRPETPGHRHVCTRTPPERWCATSLTSQLPAWSEPETRPPVTGHQRGARHSPSTGQLRHVSDAEPSPTCPANREGRASEGDRRGAAGVGANTWDTWANLAERREHTAGSARGSP